MEIAGHHHVDRIVFLGRRFHLATSPEWPWNADHFRETISGLIDAGYVSFTPWGFMAGAMVSHPLSRDWKVAAEYLWWAEDGSGPKHFRGFRKWAIDQGADEIRWSCRDDNSRVKRFYARFADPVEAHYSEVLKCA
jgi:hypothetical protein